MALYLPNIPEFVICYLAAVRVGAIAVSINSMYKSEELKYILNDSGCVLIFTTGDLLPNIPLDECPSVKQVLVCEGDPQDHPTLDDWLEKGSSQGASLDMASDDPAVLLYTSGTTGFPKGATLSHGNVVSNAWSTVHHAGFTHTRSNDSFPADFSCLRTELHHECNFHGVWDPCPASQVCAGPGD